MAEARILETNDISRRGAATEYDDPEMPEAWLKAPEGRK